MATPTTAAVTVRLLLFGSYADRLHLDTVELTLPAPASVRDVLDHLRTLPGGDGLPARPLVALNLSHVGPDARLAEGDELAVLPPLAGG